ncbi:TadE-like protein [Rosistilla carotiformis]|uniref:TadE-like protein n=1 Tax=Rosistilla carotiformis TaxID=2528017 RepID=A0A518JTQ1_9BACT|nr:TadE/TadG family type IV pilus assembly protein [Rosistilla carotiformis]QDV68931.1 TadE-like protein [Rosistilla carotiformis]
MKIHTHRRLRFDRRCRTGAVTVEMAFCIPILLFLFVASADVIRYNLLRNVVAQAAYEGARTALVQGATVAEVQTAVDDTITAFNPKLNYEVTVNPGTLPTLAATIRVTVDCDLSSDGWIVMGKFLDSDVSHSIEIRNE